MKWIRPYSQNKVRGTLIVLALLISLAPMIQQASTFFPTAKDPTSSSFDDSFQSMSEQFLAPDRISNSNLGKTTAVLQGEPNWTPVDTSASSTTSIISSFNPFNETYKPRFIIRWENDTISTLYNDTFDSVIASNGQDMVGLGIRTTYGIIGFEMNETDTVWGDGQIVTYPSYGNGTLISQDEPMMSTYLRAWLRGDTAWQKIWITNRSLYEDNGFDPRNFMSVSNITDSTGQVVYLELGWNHAVTIQGQDFEVGIGVGWNITKKTVFQIKTNITCTSRSWKGVGMEYAHFQSGYWAGTPWEIKYATATNATVKRKWELNQLVDGIQEIPSFYNYTDLVAANNETVHHIDWDDMRTTNGLNNSLYQISNTEVPSGGQRFALHVGMYANQSLPINTPFVIDPTLTTIASDAVRAFPFTVVRDSNDIPYVLGLVGTTLKIFKANAVNPTSWTNETVGDGTVKSEDPQNAWMEIGTYDSTEYIWVFRRNDTRLVVDRSTVAAFSFPDNGEVDIGASAGGPHIDTDFNTTHLVVAYVYADQYLSIKYSSDGGVTWESRIDVWITASGQNQCVGVAWNGTVWHLMAGIYGSAAAAKIWNSTGGLQYWNTTNTAWEDATASDEGYDLGSIGTKFYSISRGRATDNIIVFGSAMSGDNAEVLYSLDNGETWAETGGMGGQNYADYPSYIIKTDTGEVDDLVVFAGNYDSNDNDVNRNYYDFSEDSWSGWDLVDDSGYTADTYRYFAVTLKEQNGYIDYAYQFYDDSEATYSLQFHQYKGTVEKPANTTVLALTEGTAGYIYPYQTLRDSSDIPYVLVLIDNSLKVFKGNGVNPTAWTNETIGTGIVEDATTADQPRSASFVIAEYSGTEYIWVAWQNDTDHDFYAIRSTIASFSFPTANAVKVDDGGSLGGYPALAWGEDRLVLQYAPAYRVASIVNSTDGGLIWSSPVMTWNRSLEVGQDLIYSTGVVWDGSNWHLGVGRLSDSASLFVKRWNSTDGFSYWNTTDSQWKTTDSDHVGHDTTINWARQAILHSYANSKIITFSHGSRSDAASFATSYDGGKTWKPTSGMGTNNHYNYPEITVLTNSTHADHYIGFASDYDDNSNDIDTIYVIYADLEQSWTTFWGSSDETDTISHFAVLEGQQNEYLDLSYRLMDDSNNVTYIYWTQYAIPVNKFGQLFQSGDTINFELNSATTMASFRFTAQDSKTVDQVRFYISPQTGTSPTYSIGLQSDINGIPSGSWLNNGTSDVYVNTTLVSDGELVLDLPNMSLTAGTVYHIIFEHAEGTIDGSNYGKVRMSTPNLQNHPNPYLPYDMTADNRLWCLQSSDSGSTWTSTGDTYTPMFVFDYDDATYAGQPNAGGHDEALYGTMRRGSRFQVDANLNATHFSLMMDQSGGLPNGDFLFSLYNENDTEMIIDDITLSMSEIEADPKYLRWTLPASTLMEQDKIYRWWLIAPDSNNSVYPIVREARSTIDTAIWNGLNFQGVSMGSIYHGSTDAGIISDTPEDEDDATFHFTLTTYEEAPPSGCDCEDDFVDNNASDVDSIPDTGTHSSFANQQAGPDATYDTLAETDEGVAGSDTSDDVDSNTSTEDAQADLGTETDFANAQDVAPDTDMMNLLEVDTAEDPEEINDVDNNTSDVDSGGAETGTETSFSNAQGSLDGTYMTLNETDEGTAGNDVEDIVDAMSDLHTPSPDVGTNSSLSDMQTYNQVNNTLTEEDIGSSATDFQDEVDSDTSNQEAPTDVGTQGTFANAQDITDDSDYMNLQEGNGAGYVPGVDNEEFVEGTSNLRLPTPDVGTHSNSTTLQYYDLINDTLTEENKGGSSGGQLPSAKDTLVSDDTTSTTFEDIDGLTVSHTVDYQSDVLLFASIQGLGSESATGSWRLVYDGTPYQILHRIMDTTEPGNIVLTDLVPNKGAGVYTFKVQHNVSSGTLTTSNAVIVAISLHNSIGIVPANVSSIISDTQGSGWADIVGLSTEITLSATSHIWAIISFCGYFSANNKDLDIAINIDGTRMEVHDRDWSASNEHGAVTLVTLTDTKKAAGTYTVKGEWAGAGGATFTGENFRLVVFGAEADSGNYQIDVQKKVLATNTTTSTTMENITTLNVVAKVNDTAHVFALMTLDSDVSVDDTSAYTTISIDGTDQDVMERGHPNRQRHGSIGQVVRTDSTFSAGDVELYGRWYTDSGNTLLGTQTVIVSIVLTAVTGGSDDYELDLEVGWTSADYDETTGEELAIFAGAQGTEALTVDVWTGSWTEVIADLAPGWNNVSVSSYLTDASFEIRFQDSDQASDGIQTTWDIDAVLLHTWTDEVLDYELDFEYSWSNANYSETTETVKIYANTVPENLDVWEWNGGSFVSLGTISSTGWSNFTASFVTGSAYYIKFSDADQALDSTQNNWDIDAIFLHTSTAADPDYELDIEYGWSAVDFDETSGEELAIFAGPQDAESLRVDIWTGSWTNIIADLTYNVWNNVSIAAYLDDATVEIRFVDTDKASENSPDSWQIDVVLIHVWTDAVVDYELDREYQWTTVVNFTETNEEVAIYVQEAGTEDLMVNYYDAGWNFLGNITNSGVPTWFNFTATGLTGATYTIQFISGVEDGDGSQDDWAIDVILIHTWTDNPANYELNFEYQWTSADNDEANELVKFYMGTRTDAGSENLNLWYWETQSWVSLGTINSFGGAWNNFTATGLAAATYTIMVNGSIESGDTNVGDWDIDVIMLHTWTAAVVDMELNLEVQWTSLTEYSGTPERVSVTTGAFNTSEDIGLYEWDNTDTWIFLGNLTASTTNNYTIAYLTGATYTIKFQAWDESGDTVASEWQIDITLICPAPLDTDAPQWTYDYPGTASQNNTLVAIFTVILVNWSLTDACDNCDIYEIFSNETGTGNVSRISGSFNNGDYKSWQFDNDNTSMAGDHVFFDLHVNDTFGNSNSSFVIFDLSSIMSLSITEATFNWTYPNVVAGSGEWVYIDQPAKQYLNMSIQASGNWELRAYINDTSSELNIKAYVTNSTGDNQPATETWWDSGGTQLTGSELVISGGDNQPAGDFSGASDQYIIWLVVQVDTGGASYYGVLLTVVIYSE